MLLHILNIKNASVLSVLDLLIDNREICFYKAPKAFNTFQQWIAQAPWAWTLQIVECVDLRPE